MPGLPLGRVLAVMAPAQEGDVMAQERHLNWAEVRVAVLDCGVLAIACLVTGAEWAWPLGCCRAGYGRIARSSR